MTPNEGDADVLKLACKLRGLVKQFLQFKESSDAVYWADKLTSLTQNSVEDVYLLCNALYIDKQYKRCTLCIKQQFLDNRYPAFRLLAAKCHYLMEEWDDALRILERDEDNNFYAVGKPKPKQPPIRKLTAVETIDWGMTYPQIESRLHLLLGKVYESIENRELAEKNFKEALRYDIFCHEAFERLVHHHLLSGTEEQEVLESLCCDQCSPEELQYLKFLYSANLKKYHQVAPTQSVSSTVLQSLSRNVEVQCGIAERKFYNNQFQQCYKITKSILKGEPFYKPVLLLHVGVLVELGKCNELFALAHNLVDYHPESALAWLAVGSYYFMIGRHDPARRYLQKSISIDRMHGPSWLVNGHSYAAEKEHDQAMAAYFTATKLMRGFHLPLLYIGLEYAITNNLVLAEKFTNEALSIAPEDPNVLHELGVIAFKKSEFDKAERYLHLALEKVAALESEALSHKWEPLLNNIGHVYRATGRYQEAVDYHERALSLLPNNAASHANLGLVYCYLFDWSSAIASFHRALALKREDVFSVAMLKVALEKHLNRGGNWGVSEFSSCATFSRSSGGQGDAVSNFETFELHKLKLTKNTGALSSELQSARSYLMNASHLSGTSSLAGKSAATGSVSGREDQQPSDPIPGSRSAVEFKRSSDLKWPPGSTAGASGSAGTSSQDLSMDLDEFLS